MTIIDLKNILQNFYSSQINPISFGMMELFEFVAERDVQYPYVLFDLVSIRTDRAASVYSFDVYIIDLFEKHDKQDNWLDVVASCEKIAYDTMSYLKNIGVVLAYSTQDTMTPIRDTFNADYVAGVKMSIDITLENNINCSIPLNTAPSPILLEDGGVLLLE